MKEPPSIVVAEVPTEPVEPPPAKPEPKPVPVVQAVTPAPPALALPPADPAPAVGPVAALAPDPDPPVEQKAKPDREFIRALQEELVRVGCGTGRPDGVWGVKSWNATESFAKFGKITVASLDPTEDLLSALKQQDGRVCPLVCGARFEARGDACVLKVCPAGQKLGSNGACFTPEAARPATKNASKPASKAVTGSRCRVESVVQCIDRRSRSFGQGRSPPTGSAFASDCNNPAKRLRVCR